MRTLLVLLAALILASSASAIKLNMIGQGAPKIAVYRQSDTTAVVYDARPEFGVDTADLGKRSRDAMRAIGVRVVRYTLDWGKMEPSDKPGLYDSAYQREWDQLVSDCRSEGIHLCVAVAGEPQGLPFGDMKAARERLAGFAADMVARYPSIIFWEFSQVPGAKDGSLETTGKWFADVLRVVYPAVKTANPPAQVVCGVGLGQEFARGVYAGGGRRYYDIMSVPTTAASFEKDGKALHSLMSEFGDDTKPLWCVVSAKGANGDGSTLQSLFDLNNAPHADMVGGYYDKLLAGEDFDVAGSTSNSLYKWLSDSPPNAALAAKPRNTVNVVIPTKTPMIPIGYDYKAVEGGIEVQRVVVDALVPTVIQLRYAAEPQPAKPGAKPATPTNKRNPAPIVDPWDI